MKFTFKIPMICLLLVTCSSAGWHQNPRSPSTQPRPTHKSSPLNIGLTDSTRQQWEIGLIIQSPGLMTGVQAAITIPMDWPEQTVTIIEQDLSPGLVVRQRVISGDVKQLLITVPRVEPNQTLKAIYTGEIQRARITAPLKTDQLKIPQTVGPELRKYMGVSPSIETTHPLIVNAGRELAADAENDWQKVEIIYDWVRSHIKYKFDEELKGALQALKSGEGDCEELTSLFIAICRNHGIPSRSVWIPGHCYPEFYLEDAAGNGYWYPCQVAGSRSFGAMPEYRPVLQKGDNFRLPGSSKSQRYVAETFRATRYTKPPMIQFLRRRVGSESPFAPVLE